MMRFMNASRWFLITRPKPLARYRLFCYPYAGGNAMAFMSWEDLLPASIELVAIQPPGRGARLGESLLTSVEQMAEQLVHAIPPMLNRPYLIYGHSLGAVVGFELLHALKANHLPLPQRYFGAARRAPQAPPRLAPTHEYPLERFKAELKSLNGTPDAVLENPNLMELIVPILRTEMKAAYVYHREPEARLECEVSVFGGARDERVLPEELMGWQDHFAKQMDLRIFDGGHFFMEDNKHLVVNAICASVGLTHSGAQ
jgi:surfactin synthase thioesterase subunit